MSVNWSWKAKSGEITGKGINGKEFTASIYEGNCPLIALYEFKEDGKDMYNMYLFFVDDSHAKKCLGLAKNADGKKENLYKDIAKIRIDSKHYHFKKIVKWFSEAFPNITIEIYTSEEEDK